MKKKYWYLLFITLLIASIVISLGVGNRFSNPIETITTLITKEQIGIYNLITKIRIPRVLIAVFVGAGLAVSGALFQCALKNPLVSPDVIGINHGAVLGVSLITLFLPKAPGYFNFIVSFLFSLMTFIIVCLVNKKRQFNPVWMALSGMAIGYLIDAFNQVLMIQASKQSLNLNVAIAWTRGSLYGKSYNDLILTSILIIVLIIVALIISRSMDVLHLGDEQSISLGENPSKVRITLILLGVLINSTAVAVAGGIGFVGVISPQIAKKVLGGRHINIILGSAIIGAIIIVVGDCLARGIKPPLDLPLSIFTSIIGAPYFFYLIKRELG